MNPWLHFRELWLQSAFSILSQLSLMAFRYHRESSNTHYYLFFFTLKKKKKKRFTCVCHYQVLDLEVLNTISKRYQYLHPNMGTVACCCFWFVFLFLLLIICLAVNTLFQGQRGKIRLWNINERWSCLKEESKNKIPKPWVCENCSQYMWKQ